MNTNDEFIEKAGTIFASPRATITERVALRDALEGVSIAFAETLYRCVTELTLFSRDPTGSTGRCVATFLEERSEAYGLPLVAWIGTDRATLSAWVARWVEMGAFATQLADAIELSPTSRCAQWSRIDTERDEARVHHCRDRDLRDKDRMRMLRCRETNAAVYALLMERHLDRLPCRAAWADVLRGDTSGWSVCQWACVSLDPLPSTVRRAVVHAIEQRIDTNGAARLPANMRDRCEWAVRELLDADAPDAPDEAALLQSLDRLAAVRRPQAVAQLQQDSPRDQSPHPAPRSTRIKARLGRFVHAHIAAFCRLFERRPPPQKMCTVK